MTNADLCFLNVTELAPVVRTRKISPVEIVQALLSRIDTLNGDLTAYLHVSAEQAMAAAHAAEIEISTGGYRGPLHGIPVAYKDIYDVQGLPTTAASKVMAGYVAPEDSTVAACLRQAGAICLGKLNTNELPRSKLRGIKPPLAYSHGPASLAGWRLVSLVYGLHAHLRTTPTGRLGDAIAYSLFHCPVVEHIGE
jgi:Amidase